MDLLQTDLRRQKGEDNVELILDELNQKQVWVNVCWVHISFIILSGV